MTAAVLIAFGGSDALHVQDDMSIPDVQTGQVLMRVSAASVNNNEQLACLPTAYGTALGMLERAEIGHGETVFVTGASSGVGMELIQLAAARGAIIIALTKSDKMKKVTAAGATYVVDRDSADMETNILDAAPQGLGAVVDVVGGKAVASVLSLIREGGRWVIAGAVGGANMTFDLRRLYLHNRRLIGSSMHTPVE
ncbi:zinc-binding dehydrogenase [Salicibibacter cibi]|uniref:zinc-binding dehydrogenase n=1 Tax=Salicibibacter cibi TaxID=2743001 RepID=UPI0019052DAD|nr:zinc-binding dehydrogenase [Salicibibacter cibi]